MSSQAFCAKADNLDPDKYKQNIPNVKVPVPPDLPLTCQTGLIRITTLFRWTRNGAERISSKNQGQDFWISGISAAIARQAARRRKLSCRVIQKKSGQEKSGRLKRIPMESPFCRPAVCLSTFPIPAEGPCLPFPIKHPAQSI